MSKIAAVVFGNADGIRVVEEPLGFNVGESLRSTVDISYPFQWGKEVYRATVFENGKDRYIFVGLYTKIDDFGGARDGALAGAGVFIREGVCDGAVVVEALRRTLGQLIKFATDGAQFVTKLESVAGDLRSTLKGTIGTLSKALRSEKVRASGGGKDHVLSIVDAADWRVQSPEQFVEFVSQMLLYETNHYLYAPDPEMRDAVPFAGEYKRVSLGQRILRLPIAIADAYSQADQERRAANLELDKWKSHVQTVEASLSATREQSATLQGELQKLRQAADGYGESNREVQSNLQSQVTLLQRENTLLQEEVKRAKKGGGSGGSSVQVKSLERELEERIKTIEKLHDANDDLRRRLADNGGGTGVKPTTWIIGVVGLVVVGALAIAVWALGRKSTEQAPSALTATAVSAKDAAEKKTVDDAAAKKAEAARKAEEEATEAAAAAAKKEKEAVAAAAAAAAKKEKEAVAAAAAAKKAKDSAAAAAKNAAAEPAPAGAGKTGAAPANPASDDAASLEKKRE